MAKKIYKPQDAVERSNTENSQWNTLIPDMIEGKYVLVIGSEIVLSKNFNKECNGDSYKLIVSAVIERLKELKLIAPQYEVETLSQLAHDLANVEQHIRKTMKENLEFEVSEVSSELRALLKTKCFKVVLTTTFDPYVELAMREIWGDELRVMDIYAERGPQFDFSIKDLGASHFDMPPTLYYVFGKADEENPRKKFVVTENDEMEVIAKWLGAGAPQHFTNYIQQKRILALGCKYDDWLFRFFWYSLRRSINDLKNGEVAISLNEASETDVKLQNYLKREQIYVHPNARKFITETLSRLERYEPELIQRQRKLGGIFLSYAHEDVDVVKNLFFRLCSEGFKVWFDERDLKPSNEYDKEIKEAINQCKIFIPILSPTVQSDSRDKNLSRYYRKVEWKIAQQKQNIKPDSIRIMPFCISGYNVRDERTLLETPDFIKKVTAFNSMDEPLDSFIANLTNLLKEKY
jgi:hypothetical protein